MASFLNGAVYPNQNYVEIEQHYQNEQEYDAVLAEPNDDATEQSPSTSSAVATVILALPNPSTTVFDDSPEPKRQHTEPMEEKNDSRKLFQRLWTEEDEIVILQGFLDYNATRGSSYHNDTASFYDQIKSKLQLDFNKNQLVDKLRRLKNKYRKALQKFDSGKDFIFKSSHDQATFELSHKIWNTVTPIGVPVEDEEEINPNPNPNPNTNPNYNPNLAYTTPVKNEQSPITENKTAPSRKRPRTATEGKLELNDSSPLNRDNQNQNQNNSTNNNSSGNVENESGDKSNVPGLIEETVKNCLTPLLKELSRSSIGNPFGFGGSGLLSLNPVPFSFLNLGSGEKGVDEKWRKQQILELEVYSKRLELVQDEIKVALEELRSSAPGASKV